MGWGVAASESKPAPKLASAERKAVRAGGVGGWGESREGELAGLGVPSAIVFLPVGRPSLLLPYKGLSAFQGQTRPRPSPSQGLGGTQTTIKVRSSSSLPLRRRSFSPRETQAGAALEGGGAGADLPAGLRPIPEPAQSGLLSLCHRLPSAYSGSPGAPGVEPGLSLGPGCWPHWSPGSWCGRGCGAPWSGSSWRGTGRGPRGLGRGGLRG